MRASQLAGRSRLADLRSKNEDAGRDMDGIAPRFKRLAGDGAKPIAVSSFNLFQTPVALADRMAAMLNSPVCILEPSAGLGRLAEASVRTWPSARLDMVDISPDCCQVLKRSYPTPAWHNVIQGDFLSMDHYGMHDAVIMNPPFHNREDIKHIKHALQFLRKGKPLVGLCMNTSHREAALRHLCNHWEVLPAGIFEGTRTQAVLFRIIL